MSSRRGGALLAVLWLSAILAAIAFSLANTVRGETERTSTLSDGVRSYYLATGAIERALAYIEWGPNHKLPNGAPRYFEPGMARFNFTFPTGVATVELIPESSKFDINAIPREELVRLMINLGTEPVRAQEIAAAIVDWRTPMPPTALSFFDQQYMALNPSFRGRHASVEETEELILVKGMTPELYYGSYIRDAAGRLLPQAGLRDCVSVYGSIGPFDINSVQPAILTTIGISPAVVTAILQRRHATPFRNNGELAQFAQAGGPGFSRVAIGGNTIYTLRSTARIRVSDTQFSDMTRTVSGLYKFNKAGYTPWIESLRWYDNN